MGAGMGLASPEAAGCESRMGCGKFAFGLFFFHLGSEYLI